MNTFMGIVKSGQFIPDRPEVRNAYLAGLEDKRVEEKIGIPTESKTLRQLKYLHGVVFKYASESSGYSVEEVKGLLCDMYLKRQIESKRTGKIISYTPSLADLKKNEMSDFIESCIMLCAKEWHCVVPSPED